MPPLEERDTQKKRKEGRGRRITDFHTFYFPPFLPTASLLPSAHLARCSGPSAHPRSLDFFQCEPQMLVGEKESKSTRVGTKGKKRERSPTVAGQRAERDTSSEVDRSLPRAGPPSLSSNSLKNYRPKRVKEKEDRSHPLV